VGRKVLPQAPHRVWEDRHTPGCLQPLCVMLYVISSHLHTPFPWLRCQATTTSTKASEAEAQLGRLQAERELLRRDQERLAADAEAQRIKYVAQLSQAADTARAFKEELARVSAEADVCFRSTRIGLDLVATEWEPRPVRFYIMCFDYYRRTRDW